MEKLYDFASLREIALVKMDKWRNQMQLAAAIASIYDGNKLVLDRNTEGLSDAESLIQPPAAANCLNWVMGHIVASRHRSLKLLGLPPIWSDAEIARYQTESQAVTAQSTDALPFTQIKVALDESQEMLQTALANVSEETLTALAGERSVGQQLLGLSWHETYHAGQTDFLRRLAGKQEGGIR